MADEPSDFKRHLEEIRQAQQELQQVFDRGRRGGLWNPRDLEQYNYALMDHRRILADINRQHKDAKRVQEDRGVNIRARQAIGLKVGGHEIRTYDQMVKKERELLTIKQQTTKQLEIHERRHKSIAQVAAHTERQERSEAAKGRAGHWMRWGMDKSLGAVGWLYAQVMEGAGLHTQFEMARGATEKMGGQFARGREIPPTPMSEKMKMRPQILKEMRAVHEEYERRESERRRTSVWWKPEYPVELANNLYKESQLRAIRDKYEKKWQGKKIPGEMAQYESYGMGLGYSIPESHQFAQSGLRALPWNRMRDMKSNLAMYRGYTLDPGTLTGYQTAARTGGYEGGATALNQQLIAAFTKGKFPRALMGEFVSAATDVLGTLSTSGGVVNPKTAAHMLAVYGNAMGAGYRGSPQRTAQMLQGLHQGIVSPGGGDAGNAFVMRALGLGTGASYWDVLKRKHEGATPANVRDILQYGSTHLGRQDTLLALHGALGVKPAAAEKLYDAHAKGLLSDEMIKKQVNIGKDADLDAAKGYRTGFKTLELQKLSEKAKIAAQNIDAVTAAYDLQVIAAQAAAKGISGLTWALDNLLWIATAGSVRLKRESKTK